ncbi:MAG: hypothetical protein HKM02_01725 [Pseudomonadales bacterium]|nr:hypothetical protein [Pseudomonadales bacterium]
MTPTELEPFLRQVRDSVHKQADSFITAQNLAASNLDHAVRYSVLNEGKRIRPALCYASCLAFGGHWQHANMSALAIELIHCYSLVHDDLPCMDDDDFRRGQPTCHRQFNEALALLAGDTLQAMAFHALALAPLEVSLRVTTMDVLASAARDMAAGQSLDLDAERAPITLEHLESIHRLKTGALIRASLEMGALAAGVTDLPSLDGLRRFGSLLGLAFQVQDDVLDVIGNAQILGKSVGSDERMGKATYPSILGLASAQQLSHHLHAQALAELLTLEADTKMLLQLTDYLISRDS